MCRTSGCVGTLTLAPPRAVAILPLLTAQGGCLACPRAKLSDPSDPPVSLEGWSGKESCT